MKKEKETIHKGTSVKIIVLLVIGFLIEFFIRETYGVNSFFSIGFAFVSIGMLYYYWRQSFFHFFLVFLVGTGFFLSIDISFDLGLFTVFFISLALALICGTLYSEFESKRNYALLLLAAFVAIWIILAFNVSYRDDWLLENYLTIPFVLILAIAAKWFRFSKTSYSLIFIFMFLHIVGSHYTYSEVPFGMWLQNFLELDRNHYDRIVHFAFGLLLAYPVREVFIRVGNYKGIWALFAPIIFVFGLSAVYEIIEWGAVVVYGGDLGIAYLGTQGDVWDAQKDMLLAGLGSIIAMLVTFTIIIRFKAKSYLKELRESFKIHRGELGEVALERLMRK